MDSPSARLAMASAQGRLEDARQLLTICNPRAHDSIAFSLACENGHLEIVKLLLKFTSKENRSWGLSSAAVNGHLEVVKLLLPVSDPMYRNSRALQVAAVNGQLEIVKLLLPVSDPKANSSEPLRCAAMNGHLEVVRLLLPVSNPSACDFLALRVAATNGYLEIAKLLLPFGGVSEALERQAFIKGGGADLLLSILPLTKARKLMSGHHAAYFPRTSAMLACAQLRKRPAHTPNTMSKRRRV